MLRLVRPGEALLGHVVTGMDRLGLIRTG